MRAILIDPMAKTVTEVDFEGDYRSINRLIGSRIFTSAFVFQNEDTLYVDDEGLMKVGSAFFTISDYPQPLAGKGLILGADADGDSVDAKTPLEDLEVMFVFPAKIGDQIIWLEDA